MSSTRRAFALMLCLAGCGASSVLRPDTAVTFDRFLDLPPLTSDAGIRQAMAHLAQALAQTDHALAAPGYEAERRFISRFVEGHRGGGAPPVDEIYRRFAVLRLIERHARIRRVADGPPDARPPAELLAWEEEIFGGQRAALLASTAWTSRQFQDAAELTKAHTRLEQIVLFASVINADPCLDYDRKYSAEFEGVLLSGEAADGGVGYGPYGLTVRTNSGSLYAAHHAPSGTLLRPVDPSKDLQGGAELFVGEQVFSDKGQLGAALARDYEMRLRPEGFEFGDFGATGGTLYAKLVLVPEAESMCPVGVPELRVGEASAGQCLNQ